ncbi:hypothetical protein FAGAP_1563 [Fusarium agapanthi]|uniref:Uncharacterized protein n=1 Tax=Fusarium agapanthi TaxID=1803897 RepID=A0A9P5EAX1_9HYPO|nr:hypothetical protein FAGAP_1563 [Fusarium agapanthi]
MDGPTENNEAPLSPISQDVLDQWDAKGKAKEIFEPPHGDRGEDTDHHLSTDNPAVPSISPNYFSLVRAIDVFVLTCRMIRDVERILSTLDFCRTVFRGIQDGAADVQYLSHRKAEGCITESENVLDYNGPGGMEMIPSDCMRDPGLWKGGGSCHLTTLSIGNQSLAKNRSPLGENKQKMQLSSQKTVCCYFVA